MTWKCESEASSLQPSSKTQLQAIIRSECECCDRKSEGKRARAFFFLDIILKYLLRSLIFLALYFDEDLLTSKVPMNP